ncbi:vomeronasal type-2 receptor [Pristimantis euphronides]
MTFIFAIDEINKNSDILPNMTLGYHVYDSCNQVNTAIDGVLQILSGPGDLLPNFHCTELGNLVGVIGDLNSEISFNIAQILSLYGYSQISYGTVNPILSNKKLFPSFFQALPNYQTLSMAIIQLLRHYNWTWIGIITSDDDVSEKQSQELKTTAANYEICVEYLFKMSNIFQEKKYVPDNAEEIFNNSTSQVVVICGKVSMVVMLFIEKHVSKAHEKTFILPSNWFSNMVPPNIKKSVFYGSLIFSPPTRQIQALKSFLQDISLINRPHDFLVEFILAYSSNCLTSDPFLNKILQQVFSHQLYKCNRTIRLGEIDERMYYTNSFGVAYLVYKSVYAMAHALHEMQLHAPSHTKTKYKEIHTLMKKVKQLVKYDANRSVLVKVVNLTSSKLFSVVYVASMHIVFDWLIFFHIGQQKKFRVKAEAKSKKMSAADSDRDCTGRKSASKHKHIACRVCETPLPDGYHSDRCHVYIPKEPSAEPSMREMVSWVRDFVRTVLAKEVMVHPGHEHESWMLLEASPTIRSGVSRHSDLLPPEQLQPDSREVDQSPL